MNADHEALMPVFLSESEHDLNALEEAPFRGLALSEELEIARAGIRAAIRRERGGGREGEAMIEADRLLGALGAEIARLRLIPIGPTLHAEARAARDLAASHGKLARVVVEGDDIEVDAAVAEALRDVVTQMVRNAVDHGVEPPKVRGVGMDVVARNIAAQGGTIAISSARGLGTTIAARVPLSLPALESCPVDGAEEREPRRAALRGAA